MSRHPATLIDVAPFTLASMGICVVVYVLMMQKAMNADGGGFGIPGEVLLSYGASWREGVWDGEWQRFLAPMFLHANLLHIGLNMYSLYGMGPSAEIYFGSNRFAIIYLLSGLGGICLSQLLGGGLSVGASTSLFGILGAYLACQVMVCYDWRRALKNSDVRRTTLFILLNYAVCMVIPNVDHWGHTGGLILGFLFGALFEYQRNHRRTAVVFQVTCLLLTAGLVVACRWMVFNPHYYVHLGLKADAEGRTAEADEYFAEARRRAKTLSSRVAGNEIERRVRQLLVQQDESRQPPSAEDVRLVERYIQLYLDVTPEGDQRLRGALGLRLGFPPEAL